MHDLIPQRAFKAAASSVSELPSGLINTIIAKAEVSGGWKNGQITSTQKGQCVGQRIF